MANVGVGLYFSLIHQRAPISVTRFLAEHVGTPSVTSIDFLTNCHATPFYSHIHKPIPMRFLDCSPQFNGSELVGDRSNTDSERFLLNPLDFTESYYEDSNFPSHIVIFDEHWDKLHSYLKKQGYEELERFFNSYTEYREMVVLHRSAYSQTE